MGGSLCSRPPAKESPGRLQGGPLPALRGGAGGGGRDSMPRSLMTQAWAGGQTDIFSEEKLLWGPPSGTSLAPPARRGGLGTEPWGAGLCARELGHNVQPGYTTPDTSLRGQTGSQRGRGGAAHARGLSAFAMRRTHTQDRTHGAPGRALRALAASGAPWRTLGGCAGRWPRTPSEAVGVQVSGATTQGLSPSQCSAQGPS